MVTMLVWNVRLQLAENDRVAEIERLARRPSDRVTLLVSTPAAPNADGRVSMSADGRACVLAVTGLPALPSGRTYQFWFARLEKSRDSAGMFSVSQRGDALVSFTVPGALSQYSEVWVTQEPVGGSPIPTAPHVVEEPL
jgi:anti-sigma-K factor RskA